MTSEFAQEILALRVSSVVLKKFAWLVGGIFAFIGFVPYLWSFGAKLDLHVWALVLASSLILPGIFFPNLLLWPYRIWMLLGHFLGAVNSKIIMALMFYLLITPIGIFRRILGKSEIVLNFQPQLTTYRINIKRSRSAKHIERVF